MLAEHVLVGEGLLPLLVRELRLLLLLRPDGRGVERVGEEDSAAAPAQDVELPADAVVTADASAIVKLLNKRQWLSLVGDADC